MATLKAKNLALAISSCSDVCTAISDKNHPCHKVVDWQADKHGTQITEVLGSKLHRPEPWTGDLESAKILFLSSNPSFNPVENYPNWNSNQWTDDEISSFGAERFSISEERKFGATDSRIKTKQDRTIGFSGERSSKVHHWTWVRRYAAFVLGKEISNVSAISDYVMTELVHCKSPHEEGVLEALSHCVDQWFGEIMDISPASLIFVTGAKAAEAVTQIYGEKIPSDWGSWSNRNGKGKGRWPKSLEDLEEMVNTGQWGVEVQKRNTCTIEINGIPRMLVYIARNTPGGIPYTPWTAPYLVHEEILKMWRDQIS